MDSTSTPGAAYDERRNSVVMFGGQYAGNAIPGLAEPGLSGRTFKRVLADEPVLLRLPQVAQDAASNRLLVRVIAAGVPP